MWHIAWCWRETPDVVTNFDLCYAKSLDHGKSWKSWDGRDLELPITPDSVHVVESISQRSGLMNGGTLVVDVDGYPYIGYTRFDKNGCNQIYIASPVDKEWKIIRKHNHGTVKVGEIIRIGTCLNEFTALWTYELTVSYTYRTKWIFYDKNQTKTITLRYKPEYPTIE